VDIEFAAQHLQIIHAAAGGPLDQNTGAALAALEAAGLGRCRPRCADLLDAWRLQQDLAQLLKLALDDRADPDDRAKGAAGPARPGRRRAQTFRGPAQAAHDLARDKARRAFDAT
jgi:glutamate-ammonia-ligase adenylyltransferase